MSDDLDEEKRIEYLQYVGRPIFSWEKRPPVFGPRKPKVLINIILFFVTILTTIMAGAMLQGVNPVTDPGQVTKGFSFSFALIFILLSHELGHFIASRVHKIDATLPYFIPAPTFIGTFGAFIKMRSPVLDRRALLDVGASGPLTGFIVALPFLIAGLKLSEVKVIAEHSEGGFVVGSSSYSPFCRRSSLAISLRRTRSSSIPLLLPGGSASWLPPSTFCPWGSLTGGHIAYAVFGEKQGKISKATFVGLGVLGTYKWVAWILVFTCPDGKDGWSGHFFSISWA